MLILKILDHDMHRARGTSVRMPHAIIVPDAVGHVPVLVSSTRGQFLVRRKLFQGGHPCGVFPWDSDRMDDILGTMFSACLDLAREDKFPNIFKTAKEAFDYIQQQSGTKVQPHACLVPETWTRAQLKKWGGKDLHTEGGIDSYKKTCRVYQCKTPMPVFCSRPDFVGLYTQFMGSRASILIHNVRGGMAFHDFAFS